MRPIRLLTAVLAALTVSTTLAVPAAAEDAPSWTSIYAGTPYEGSGWSRCPEPITISVDARALKKTQRKTARRALVAALNRWNNVNVVTFKYVGHVPVNFDKSTGITTPVDGQPRDRHIYVAVVDVKKSGDRDAGVVGLAAPLRVDPANQIILEGSAAFLASYVNKRPFLKIAELFAHEIGHVGGLGHSASGADVMYPILQGKKDLGPGDIQGMNAVLKDCPTAVP